MLRFYTDGSSREHARKGGAAIVVLNDYDDILIQWMRQYENVTNNQMELQAILHSLEIIEQKHIKEECVILSDSAYCINMLNNWIYGWAINGWRRFGDQPILNLDLVKAIYEKIQWSRLPVTFEKVPGHKNVLGNELADRLATNKLAEFIEICEQYGIQPLKIENDLIF